MKTANPMVCLRITQLACRERVTIHPTATLGYIVVGSFTVVLAALAERLSRNGTNNLLAKA